MDGLSPSASTPRLAIWVYSTVDGLNLMALGFLLWKKLTAQFRAVADGENQGQHMVVALRKDVPS